MALAHNTLLGTYNPGGGKSFPVYAYAFSEGGQLQIAQEIVKDKVYALRTRNFVLAATHSFTQHSGFNDTLAATLPASTSGDIGGYLKPSDFVAPMGWGFEAEAGTGNPLLVKTGYSVNNTDSGGVSEGNTVTARAAGIVDTVWSFVKEQPMLSIGGFLLLLYLVHTIIQSGQKKKSKFLGVF